MDPENTYSRRRRAKTGEDISHNKFRYVIAFSYLCLELGMIRGVHLNSLVALGVSASR